MFTQIRSERLLVRPMVAEDAEALWKRRNDPRVAEYQDWTTPYPRRREEIAAAVAALEDPKGGEWMFTVSDPDTDDPLGDLYAAFSWGGRSVEIGYTFHPDHWGRGYAVEAVEALLEYLFDTLEVTRVLATLHPDNRPSAQVLERTGFRFEGHTRQSFWKGDEVSDDMIYGLLRPDWEEWRNRPRTPPDEVRLIEVTGEHHPALTALETYKSQESFVAPMLESLSQALLAPSHPEDPVTPWYRAIEADGDIVGFVMVALDAPDDPEPFLWRLLIDRLHQRRGIATRALDQVEAEMHGLGHDALRTSWVPGRGSPGPFYESRGYRPTGEIEGDELVGRKVLG